MSRSCAPAPTSSAVITRQVTSAVPRSPTPTISTAEADHPEHRHQPPDPARDDLRARREQLGAEQDSAIFISSEGWICTGPAASQAREPLTSTPTPGTMTSEAEEDRAAEDQRGQRAQRP